MAGGGRVVPGADEPAEVDGLGLCGAVSMADGAKSSPIDLARSRAEKHDGVENHAPHFTAPPVSDGVLRAADVLTATVCALVDADHYPQPDDVLEGRTGLWR